MRHSAHLAIVWIFVAAAAAASAQQPVTITTTAEFERANHEGLVVTAQDRLTRDRITAGTLQPWDSATSLPLGTVGNGAAVSGGFVYVVGGSPDGYSAIDDVLYAPLNANGTLGAWSSTTSLPSARASLASVAYNGFVYAIGGTADFSAPMDEVLVAPVNADGSLGDWTATTALPAGRFYHSCFAYNGFVYVIGGTYDGSFGWYDDVVYAPLNADGSVGDWSPATDLPTFRYFYSTAALGGFVYLMGGYDPDFTPLTDVFVAAINADGSMGAFTVTTPLPSGRNFHSSASHNGFVYVIGGYNENGALADVLSAPVDADGELGDWTALASLPAGALFPAAVAHHDSILALGGFDENFGVMADVAYAAIDSTLGSANQTPELLRGSYSFLVDFDTDIPARSIVVNGETSPGGVVRLQVRLAADADAVFGAETVIDSVTLGSVLEVLGAARYVWIRVTLDDTLTTDVLQATQVSDLTILPFLPPTPGVVSDGSGADVDAQSATSTIEANWSGFTPSAGDTIAHYEWAIGTSPGATNIQNWVNVGLATSASNTSLSLTPGVKFVSVRATGASGLTSTPATSDGVQVVQSTPEPDGSGDSDHKGRCNQSASASPGSALALLAGLVLLALLRRA